MSSLSAVVSTDEVAQIAAYLDYLDTQNRGVKPSIATIEVIDANATTLLTTLDNHADLLIPESMQPPILLRENFKANQAQGSAVVLK